MITKVVNNTLTKYSDLTSGDTFMYNDELYIMASNNCAVKLTNGQMISLPSTVQVIAVECTLTITSTEEGFEE